MKPIKKQNLILGVVIALVISCTTLYFITINTTTSSERISKAINELEENMVIIEIEEEAEISELETVSKNRIQWTLYFLQNARHRKRV